MWSKEKKLLESKLASSLKGKIKYNLEGGRKTTWGATYKVEILYNDKPVIKFGEGINYMTGHYEFLERRKLAKPTWSKEENYNMFVKAQSRLWNEGIYTTDIFFHGMCKYLSLSIDDALNSEQWMIRLFALLDSRLGKRRLIRLKDTIKEYPKILVDIYKIRVKEEGLDNEMFDL